MRAGCIMTSSLLYPALRLLLSSSSVAHLQLWRRQRGGVALAYLGGVPLGLVLPLWRRQWLCNASLGFAVPRGGNAARDKKVILENEEDSEVEKRRWGEKEEEEEEESSFLLNCSTKTLFLTNMPHIQPQINHCDELLHEHLAMQAMATTHPHPRPLFRVTTLQLLFIIHQVAAAGLSRH